MWTFEWWPHALGNGLNPFHPDVIWAPAGANLTQGGFALPAAAIVLMPVTLVAGPVVAYNVASVLMPVLSAWFAYRLCLYLSGKPAPAFAGGLVFGFGTYMSAHLLGHLNLTSVFLAPAAVLLVLQRLDRVISQRRFVALMAVVFAVQVLLSAEMLLLGLLVGGFALVVGYLSSDAERRIRVRALVMPILGAGGIAMLLASPYLYWVVKGLGDANSESWRTFTELYSNDALNPILPTEVTGIGHRWFEATTEKFTNFTLSEAASYVGVVLLGIVAVWAVTNRRRPVAKVVVGVLAFCFVLSLGTDLHVAGNDTGIWMPWSLLHPLPVFDHVISARIWAYAVLVIAIGTALWLAEATRRAWLRWAVAVVGLALLVPNVSSNFWDGRPTNPAFFTGDGYKRHLKEGERVLALPYARFGSSMLWQAQTGMYFDMVEGYVSPEYPSAFRDDPYFPKLTSGRVSGPEDVEGMRDFIARRGVTAVVVGEGGTSKTWAFLLGALGLQPVRAGGVLVYRVGS